MFYSVKPRRHVETYTSYYFLEVDYDVSKSEI